MHSTSTNEPNGTGTRIETPDSVLAGATAPGLPGVVLGHNGRIAWTFTTTGADVQDLFVETPASGPPQDGTPNTDGYGDIQQGSLEQANVEAVTEISDLIAAQRAYEMNAKVVSAADQMMQSTSNMFR